MPPFILWRDALPEKLQNLVHAELNQKAMVVFENDKDKLVPHLDHITILIDGKPPPPVLDAPNLRHVIVPWAGVSPELRQAVLDRPRLKLYNSHYNAPAVAQHAAALLLACANRLVEVDRTFRKGNWQHAHDPGFHSVLLRNKTCLLLGYGAIGKQIAPIVRALGMKVTVAKRNSEQRDPAVDTFYRVEDLPDAVQEADALIISLPLTPSTEGLIDHEVFHRMKPTSILINVGRGAVIDQHALHQALQSRRILAAGLDVWWRYPENKRARADTLPAEVPIHEHPNLIMSPHRADQVQESRDEQVHDVLRTLECILEGKSRNQVDPERGY